MKTKWTIAMLALVAGSACATVHGTAATRGPLEPVLGEANDREARAAARVADRPDDAWARLARALLARRAADAATETSELLSLSEAADIIASTESMVMRLSKQGKLTLVYLGPKTKRVTRKSVYAFLAELTGEAQ